MGEREPNGAQEPKSDIEEKLRALIAKQFGVSPDEVTVEFIRAKRAELYARPDHKFIFEDELGNEAVGLKVRNLGEVEAEAEKADTFLKQFEDS